MIKINEAVERSALTLESEQRSAASAAYLKLFMFKKTTMTAKPTTYNAPQVTDSWVYTGISEIDNVLNTFSPQSSVLNKHLTAGVFDNERSITDDYYFGLEIGTDKEHRLDMSTEISAVRSLMSRIPVYNAGYTKYGQYVASDGTLVLRNGSTPLLSGAGFASAHNSEYLHKWDMLTDNVRVRKRFRNSKDSGGFRNVAPECEKPVTNICYAYSHSNSNPTGPQNEGKSPLSFSIFDNSTTMDDVSTGSLYRADARMLSHPPTSDLPNMSAFIASAIPQSLTKRAVHSGGLSWRGYQYAISPISASVSTDGFDTVTELRTPFAQIDPGVYGGTRIENPSMYVYPTEAGVVLQQYVDVPACTVSGTDIIRYDETGNTDHRLLWREYYFRVVNDSECRVQYRGDETAFPRNATLTLPTGPDFSDTDGLTSVSSWMIANTGAKLVDRYVESYNPFLLSIATNLATPEEKGMALTSVVLDKAEVVVAPLREAYVKSGNSDYCIIPIAGLAEQVTPGEYPPPPVPALLVIDRQALSMTVVDLSGFTTVPDASALDRWFDPSNMCMVSIGDRVGLVSASSQYVLKPGEDPTNRDNWVYVEVEWEADTNFRSHYTDETVGDRTLLNLSDKYKFHRNPFVTSPWALSQATINDFTPTPGENILALNTPDAWTQYDCYTVTDYARYPVCPMGLAGTDNTVIAYPVLREIVDHAVTPSTDTDLFPDDTTWKGFYFAIGTMVVKSPAITSYMTDLYDLNIDQYYASTTYNTNFEYPSWGTLYSDGYSSRPRVVGGFSIIPRNALVGPLMNYEVGV